MINILFGLSLVLIAISIDMYFNKVMKTIVNQKIESTLVPYNLLFLGILGVIAYLIDKIGTLIH